MEQLIRDILALAKSIYDDENTKHGHANMKLGNFFVFIYSIKEEDLKITIGADWSGRRFAGDRDLYRYTLVIEPDGWPNDKCIRIIYGDRKHFLSQKYYNNSGAVRHFNDEAMLNHIQNVLEQIAKKRDI